MTRCIYSRNLLIPFIYSQAVNLLTSVCRSAYHHLVEQPLQPIIPSANGGDGSPSPPNQSLTNGAPDAARPHVDVDSVDEDASRHYMGYDMYAVQQLLEFLHRQIDKCTKDSSKQHATETMVPVLTCVCETARCCRMARKYFRMTILPPLTDVYHRPEIGQTLRNKLCHLMTSPVTDVKELIAEFLFILCKENGLLATLTQRIFYLFHILSII